jgi:hypothetical protein
VDIAASSANIETEASPCQTLQNFVENPEYDQHNVFGNKKDVDFLYTTPGTDIHACEDNDMREHERRLWMLLMYARPCLQHFTAEDYTSVCQKLTCCEYGSVHTKDTIVAKLEYQMQDNRLKCIIEDDEQAPLFFEKISKNAAGSSTQCHKFPPYVLAIISRIPSRTCIYIPKQFAIELRKQCSKQSPLHAKLFTHENSTWKMVCVGVRHWAWKRLMVKSIFFDAFAKSMTRSSVQLSLYGPRPFVLEDQIQAHKQTSSIFGDLQYKISLLKRNNTKKQVQLIFTVHTKQRRQGTVNSRTTAFDQQKIKSITRQMEFVKYCKQCLQNVKGRTSCRYMRVDTRIVQRFLEEVSARELNDDDQICYRSYLYLKTESTDVLVRFRNELYIKFPTDYAIIRNEGGYETGLIKTYFKEHKYATCFDTRTYSCAQTKLQRKADSVEFMAMIQECTNEPKSTFDEQSWPSTKELTECSKSWIYQENRKVMLCKEVSAVIEQTLAQDCDGNCALTVEDQQHMYTLPDYFSKKQNKKTDIESKCQSPEIVNPHSWTIDISQWPSASVDQWISLRCTTKTIACQARILIESDDNIDHEVLKPLLRKIRNSLKTPTYIDTEM